MTVKVFCMIEESANCALLSSFSDDSNLHIYLLKYVLSTMRLRKESICMFLIVNRFSLELRNLVLKFPSKSFR